VEIKPNKYVVLRLVWSRGPLLRRLNSERISLLFKRGGTAWQLVFFSGLLHISFVCLCVCHLRVRVYLSAYVSFVY
jgi:hypothetical protein